VTEARFAYYSWESRHSSRWFSWKVWNTFLWEFYFGLFDARIS